MTLDEFKKLLPRGVRYIIDGQSNPETITSVVILQAVYKPEGGMGPDRRVGVGYGVSPAIAMSNAIRNMDLLAVGGIARSLRVAIPVDCSNNLTGGQHFQG